MEIYMEIYMEMEIVWAVLTGRRRRNFMTH
jgi:hypothetical protein